MSCAKNRRLASGTQSVGGRVDKVATSDGNLSAGDCYVTKKWNFVAERIVSKAK